jgi:hypothetical protein
MEVSTQPQAVVLLRGKEVLQFILNRRLGRRQNQPGGFEFITSKLIMKRKKAGLNMKDKQEIAELHFRSTSTYGTRYCLPV